MLCETEEKPLGRRKGGREDWNEGRKEGMKQERMEIGGERGRGEGGWMRVHRGVGGGEEGRGRSEEGGWERERGRKGHRWVVLAGGLRDMLVVDYLHRSI